MLYTRPKSLKQKLKKLALILLGLYIMVGTALYVLQEKFLFLPETLPQDYTYELAYDYDEYFLDTPDNGVINALHIKAINPKGFVFEQSYSMDSAVKEVSQIITNYKTQLQPNG